MFTVELYAKIRRAVMVDGVSRREAARGSCPISWCSFWLPLTAFGLSRAVDVMPAQLAG